MGSTISFHITHMPHCNLPFSSQHNFRYAHNNLDNSQRTSQSHLAAEISLFQMNLKLHLSFFHFPCALLQNCIPYLKSQKPSVQHTEYMLSLIHI